MRRSKIVFVAAIFAGSLLAWDSALGQAARPKGKPASAPPPQERGFYLGGALGQAEFKNWCQTATAVLLSCDDETSPWKIFGGYRFNQHVGFEATYLDWGRVSGTVLSGGTVRDVSAEQTSMGIAIVGAFALTPQASVFGKFGFLMTEQETRSASAAGTATGKADETELHFGFGARFQFTPKWAARAEWERADELKAQMLSIGIEYRF